MKTPIHLPRAVVTIALLSACAHAAPAHRYQTDPPPFKHGVASADPLPDAVLIWTRAEGESQITYAVWDAATGSFENNVTAGTVAVSADDDFTVTLDITGLEPNKRYSYAFETMDGSVRSREGSTQTAPLANDTSFSSMNIATLSCACHFCGFLNSYREMAQDASLDLVIALGDWLYPPPYQTNSDYGGCVRVPRGLCDDDLFYEPSYNKCPDSDLLDVPDIPPASYCAAPADTRALDHLRYQHMILNTDLDVRALRAAHPMINIPDNHDIEEVRSLNFSANPEWKAWLEWVPTRFELSPDGELFFPQVFRYGPMLDVVRMDTRASGKSENPPSYLGQRQIDFLEHDVFGAGNKTNGWRILCSSQVFMPWAIRPEGWEPLVVGLMMAFIAPITLGLLLCVGINYRRSKVVKPEQKDHVVVKQHYLEEETEESFVERAKAAGARCGVRCEICCLSKICMGVAAVFLVTFFVLLIWGLGFVRETVLNPDSSFFSSHLGMGNIQPRRGSAWDGDDNPIYRMDLLNQMKRLDAKNNIFITGDMHTSLASDVFDTAPGIARKELIPSETTYFGVEFLGSSVNKANLDERIERAVREWASLLSPPIHWAFQQLLYGSNPHMHYWESLEHGYGIMRITPDRVRFEFRWQEFRKAGVSSRLGHSMTLKKDVNHF